MAKGKVNKKTEKTRKSNRAIKKPTLESSQDCVMYSVSKANSRKKKKIREQKAERVRKFRIRKEAAKYQPSSSGAKTLKKK